MSEAPLNHIDRCQGALLGLALGDGLGTTLEFSRPRDCVPFPEKMDGPLKDIEGGGPFSVLRGQTTDDTQMASALAVSLARHSGYDQKHAASLYSSWVRFAFDCGGQTRGSLSKLNRSGERMAGYDYWDEGGRQAAGNGSLMRAAPIGVFFSADAEGRTRASVLDSMITHADPRCILACVAYNWAIARAVSFHTKKGIFQGAESGLEAGVAFLSERFGDLYELSELRNAREQLHEDLLAAKLADPGLIDPNPGDPGLYTTSGFVRTAFRYAFWALEHATDYREAIIDVVNRGGDSDTNGAIAGGLLGAYFGKAGLPVDWVVTVLSALSDCPASPWWKFFHPRYLLAVLDPVVLRDFECHYQDMGTAKGGYQWDPI